MHRRTRRTDDLVSYTNQELARLERENRKRRANSVTMGDNNNLAEQLRQIEETVQRLQARLPVEGPRLATIAEADRPHAHYTPGAAIVPPPIDGQDWDISIALITLIKQNQFHGLPSENPNDHIDSYEDLCTTTRSIGVPPDHVKCKLFHHSLADKGTRWLKSLPPGSLRSWEEVRNAFLDFFYTKSKTAQLRSRITQFRQHANESFYEAWERFKEYKRECPHHGYSDVQILTIFYDGIDWNYKQALDSASEGDFSTKTNQDAFKLIENMAASSSSRSQEYDRSRNVSSIDARKFDELNEKLNLIILSNQRGVQQVETGTKKIR